MLCFIFMNFSQAKVVRESSASFHKWKKAGSLNCATTCLYYIWTSNALMIEFRGYILRSRGIWITGVSLAFQLRNNPPHGPLPSRIDVKGNLSFGCNNISQLGFFRRYVLCIRQLNTYVTNIHTPKKPKLRAHALADPAHISSTAFLCKSHAYKSS